MIIICAKADDTHAGKVVPILQEKYAQEVFIFDTSTFPTAVSLTARFGNGATGMSLLTQDSRQIRLQDVTSIWWRRPQAMEIDPVIVDPQARGFAFQECISALYGTLECCETLWVNNIQNDIAAEYKPYQLKVASEHGFTIPDTLITSEPEALMQFWNQHRGRVIYKSFNQRALAWRPTRLLQEQDFMLVDNLRHAPVIFQAVIPGIRDVRVTVIGNNIIATEYDIEQLDSVDYRLRMMEIPCRPHILPPEMETKIHAYMTALGLEYGGIDFRLMPDGQYVFFEINTAGEFLYLEDRTGQPIADTMAAHLAGGKPARPAVKATSKNST
jgi:glutathione synthase/RimK-type ligase-like ATP-grasp enzyme